MVSLSCPSSTHNPKNPLISPQITQEQYEEISRQHEEELARRKLNGEKILVYSPTRPIRPEDLPSTNQFQLARILFQQQQSSNQSHATAFESHSIDPENFMRITGDYLPPCRILFQPQSSAEQAQSHGTTTAFEIDFNEEEKGEQEDEEEDVGPKLVTNKYVIDDLSYNEEGEKGEDDDSDEKERDDDEYEEMLEDEEEYEEEEVEEENEQGRKLGYIDDEAIEEEEDEDEDSEEDEELWL